MFEWIKEFSTFLALLGGPGLFGLVFYGAIKKSKGDLIRLDNADLRASNQELRTERAGHLATIAEQEKMIDNLQKVATQTPEVKQLLQATSEQQQATSKQHTEVIREISNLAKRMSEMTTEFSKVAQAITINTKSQDANTASRK